LIYGPPGTGKTKLARAISNYLDIEMVYVRLDELISSYLGKTGKNIREIFDVANKESVIIFLDEIDTIAKHRDDDQELGELKRVVTVLLQNIDMLSPNSILIAATNHPHMLDNALWRRFPYKLDLELPQKEERKKLIKLFFGEQAKNVDADILSEISGGLSGSDIKDLSEKVLRRTYITPQNLDNLLAFSVFIKGVYSQKTDRKTKKMIYEILLGMHRTKKYSLQQLSDMSGIAYTTLRDNIEENKK
jgi:SpoVK/Ycf46/Vps4 family AAA+-type ATPase